MKREPAAEDAPPKEVPKRFEGRHLVFRRALAAYARVCDQLCEKVVSPSGNRRVIDRAVVYRDRSYF